MGSEPILSWILFYGLWVVINHFHTGTALLCYGTCFEVDDDLISHPRFSMSLIQSAPRCTNATDSKMRTQCYDGCMKDFIKVDKTVPAEFVVMYGCDRSSVPAGWHNSTSPDDHAYWKCTTKLCNVFSEKYIPTSATAVPSSNTQAPSPAAESPAFGKLGILLPITNAMNFNWTAFVNTIKSIKF